jgi:two-component system, OmpR family, sensor kinase
MRLPIRTRLTLLFAGLSAVVLAVAGAALLIGFRSSSMGTVDEGLRSTFESLAGDPPAAIGRLPASDETFAQFVTPDGTLVTTEPAATERLLPPSFTGPLTTTAFFDRVVPTLEEAVPVRVLAGPVDGGVLMVAVDVEEQQLAFARLVTMVVIGAPVLMAFLAIVGWWLAGSALRPVERLRQEAAAISTLEPSRRLAEPETADELQRLAETLNAMLDRLQEALERERRFVDEASHELRTPLGVLRAEVELALREPRGRDELEAALRSVEEEANRLGRLTTDLLLLARSDRGRLPVHAVDTDVADLLQRIAAGFEGRASAAGVRLTVTADGARGRVDPDRLRQAVENLVENALRQVGPGGAVDVEASRDGDELLVTVRDDGRGFAENVLPTAFEPFARDDRRRGDGAGLGLTIVRAVAEAHGGRATAENLPRGGAAVSLHLPA